MECIEDADASAILGATEHIRMLYITLANSLVTFPFISLV